MKVNNYAIVPAAVRYDTRLTASALQVYMEISAAVNLYGICDEDNTAISRGTRLNERSVNRLITQLVEAGHLKRITVHGQSKLRLVYQELAWGGAEELELVKPNQELKAFFEQLIYLWEEGLGTKVVKPDLYYPLIEQRLGKFTKEELLSSIKNRIHYVTKTSAWHTDPSNRQYQIDISIFLRDDDMVHKYLNLKPEESQQLIKFNN